MGAIIYDQSEFAKAHHIDCGIALMRCNRHIQAVIEFEIALRIDPVDRFARWNRCMALLSLGEYKKGMPEHDWAWEIYNWRALGEKEIEPILPLPIWKGERCRLLVYHEMGFGDAIMCLRFFPQLFKLSQSVTLCVREELVSLFEGYGATVLAGVPPDIDISKFDARISLFNAIHVMGHDRQTIPSKPYLPQNFDFRGGKMGIVWGGNSQVCFTPESFLFNLDTEGYELYALFKPERPPAAQNIHQLLARDFKETADIMRTMDVIVTCDTAAAHLAGAMGHPNTHLVLPYLRDWRWWFSEVWYPTLHIYPQDDPGDWNTVFDRVNAAIKLNGATWA